MAASVQDIQAALDTQGLANQINLVKQHTLATTTLWYATGGKRVVGKCGWVSTTRADATAVQSAAIVSSMKEL